MFKHILVPLDGSKLSEASLAPAAVLAETLKAPVTLLHIIEQDAPEEVHKDRHLTRADEAAAYLRAVAQRAFPAGVKVTTHVHTAPVADVASSIVDHVTAEIQPDLIVTCTHGRSGVHDILFGSIAQQVVAQGKTPLLLIKPGGQNFKLQEILIPLDPDSEHDESLAISEELARAFQARLTLLSVIPTFTTLAGEQAAAGNLMPVTAQAFLEMKEESTHSHLQEHVEAFQKTGIKSAYEIARGNPAGSIVKAADGLNADLIVLSTHRRAGMDAFWARSVAPKVAQRTKVPLLLIPLE